MNRVLHIGGALVLGVLVVASAYYVSQKDKPSPSNEIIANTQENTLQNNVFEFRDSDGDGTPDWKEDYDSLDFETIDTPSPALAKDQEAAENYEPPTTFTGQFGVAFFEDYMMGGMNGTNFIDPTAFVGSAINSINANTESSRYTRLDFTLVDGDFDSLRAYGNSLGFILQLDASKIVQDAFILQEALATRNPGKLDELKPIEEDLEQTINLLRGIEVPAQMSQEHLELLNTYESIRATVAAMQVVFNDPLFTLARLRNYLTDMQGVSEILKVVTNKLTAEGIVYTYEEPGAQLYLSDI